jgi:hypothetical protein
VAQDDRKSQVPSFRLITFAAQVEAMTEVRDSVKKIRFMTGAEGTSQTDA